MYNGRKPQLKLKMVTLSPKKNCSEPRKIIIFHNINNCQQRICIMVKKNEKNILFTLNNCQFVRYLFDDSANHNLVLHAFYYLISDPIQRTSYPLLITIRQIKLISHPILPEPLLLSNY